MTDRPPIPDLVRPSRLIAIGRSITAAQAPRIGEALVAGGVQVMELTLNEPEADARFIVSPHTDRALVAWCAERGLPCFPGALSPTEIHAAWSAGAGAAVAG